MSRLDVRIKQEIKKRELTPTLSAGRSHVSFTPTGTMTGLKPHTGSDDRGGEVLGGLHSTLLLF